MCGWCEWTPAVTLICNCLQGLDALDAGKPVVEAVSWAVKELEVTVTTTQSVLEGACTSTLNVFAATR